MVAQDQDSLNAPVQYSISGEGSNYFSVNPSTGMVSVQDTAGVVRGRQYLIHASVSIIEYVLRMLWVPGMSLSNIALQDPLSWSPKQSPVDQDYIKLGK